MRKYFLKIEKTLDIPNCEARQKIDPKAFIELNDSVTRIIYEKCDDLKLWNGYRLSAIDGSVLEIPDTNY